VEDSIEPHPELDGDSMKFRVTFKTPDAVQYALEELPADADWEAAQKALDKFVEYNEYVRIEFDTDNRTATVLPIR
jgi:hypothetical protein